MHYAPRAGKILICQSNTQTEGAVTLWGLCPFRGRGAPDPQTFNPQIKQFCILTIQVLCISYTNSFSQLTISETQTDHYSAIVHPQTKKSRPGAKIIAVLRPFCFQQSIKPTTSFFNNGKAKWISPGKDHLLRISPYFFHWDSISRDSVENLSLRFYA